MLGVLCALPVTVKAQSLEGAQNLLQQIEPLAGSWQFTYDVPGFGPPIPALITFTQGGLLVESDYPGPTPFGGAVGIAIASNGHGAWKQVAKNRFTYTYKKILYNQDGSQYGVATTIGLVTINGFHTELKTQLGIQFADKTGRVVFTGAGTATATRIED